MILPGVVLLAVLIGCTSRVESGERGAADEWEELRRVDSEIELRRARQRYL